MELSYATRMTVRQALGPSAEPVFDVITHHYTGTGVELAHRQVATEANVSEKTVRRIIDQARRRGMAHPRSPIPLSENPSRPAQR